MAVLHKIPVYSGNDPFTVPQMKVVWVRTSIPGIKTPVMKYKYLHIAAYLVVEGPDEDDVKSGLRKCLEGAAFRATISGIISGFASGGSAAIAAAVATFAQSLDSCIEEKLKRTLRIVVKYKADTVWGNWV